MPPSEKPGRITNLNDYRFSPKPACRVKLRRKLAAIREIASILRIPRRNESARTILLWGEYASADKLTDHKNLYCTNHHQPINANYELKDLY